jgi:hypothetical protein
VRREEKLFPFTYLERESEDVVVVALAQWTLRRDWGRRTLGLNASSTLATICDGGYWDRVVVAGGYDHGLNGK